MPNIKTKHRLILLFTMYFFLFMIVLSAVFIGVLRIVFIYQARKDVVHEFGEVTVDHIGIDEQGIFFKKDKKGETLRNHLYEDGIDALFLDKNKRTVRSYGLYESKKISEVEMQSVFNYINTSHTKSAVIQEDLVLGKEKNIVFITPFKYKGSVVGFMVLSKSYGSVGEVTRLGFMVFTVMSIIGLAGSFVLGYLTTNAALSPIYTLIHKISKTDLNRLHDQMKLGGHPEDEFVILSESYNQMLKRIDNMSMRQKEFIANASHEIKTPLTRAILSLEVLERKSNDVKEIQEVKQDLFELAELIDQLLILGNLAEQHIPKGSSNISGILTKLLDKYKQFCAEKHIQLKIDVDKQLIFPVPEEYMIIVIGNILSNAIKYSPPERTIHIKEGIDHVSIIDNGYGMSSDEQSRIFDRFYRGKHTRHNIKGTGLGMNLVKQICEMYRIKVDVVSEKNKGTTVILTKS